MEVKAATFARMAGVSRPSISGKIKNKTLIVNAAGFLDTDNPVNARYIAEHNRKAEAAAAQGYAINGGGPAPYGGQVSPVKLPAPAAPASPPRALDDFEISQLAGGIPRELLNLSLRELVIRYPGLEKIERYAKILKDITMSAEKEQRIQERNLTLIEKDFVVSRVFGFIDTLTKQAMEYPESVADRLIGLSKSMGEAARNEIVLIMREGIGRVINGAKDQVLAELNALKSKYQSDNKSNDHFEELKQAIEEARNE